MKLVQKVSLAVGVLFLVSSGVSMAREFQCEISKSTGEEEGEVIGKLTLDSENPDASFYEIEQGKFLVACGPATEDQKRFKSLSKGEPQFVWCGWVNDYGSEVTLPTLTKNLRKKGSSGAQAFAIADIESRFFASVFVRANEEASFAIVCQ